jgi:hypothetical protein
MRRGGRHRAAAYPLTKISAWVDATDWAWLQSRHRYDASAVLRQLIGQYRRKIEEPEEELAPLDLEELDLENL